MSKDSQSRKWQVTFNNPVEHGYAHEEIKKRLNLLSSVLYWCMCDEIGEQKTYHTHLFIAFASAVRFSTMSKKFEGVHLEPANGTSQQNRDYVRKEGKWADDEKKETNLPETFEEFGEMPQERQGQRTDITALYDMVKDGLSTYEILENRPSYMLHLDKIERTRQIVRENSFRKTWRNVEVTYVFGKTGAGKTRTIMEQYGYENVYRVTDYEHPFDSYAGQDVLIFEEFRSSLRIADMLNYLDGYPIELPCRFFNRIACFTKVFVVTNIPLEAQYSEIQINSKETWKAFLRRFQKVVQYEIFGPVEYDSIAKYYARNEPLEQVQI